MLLLDAGNSRCKWARVEAGQWLARGASDNARIEGLAPEFARLRPPSRILVSNVAGAAMEIRLRALLAGWPAEPEFIIARTAQCGVRNGYAQAQQLGSDRWAALIGAWHQVHGACLVVTCGTATTVDALSDDGAFIGGLILPGAALMQRSLHDNAALLQPEDGTLREFPLNTADAIRSGAIRATQGAIMRQYNLLQQRSPAARCLLSGGAAESVMAQLTVSCERRDDLVLQGLQVMGENEA